MLRSLVLIALLTGCGGTVVQDRPTTVSVLTTVPCVSGERPEAVKSLREAHPNWNAYTHKQKAQIVAAYVGRLKNYGQELDSSTSACR